jgi:hemerythrin
MSHVYWTEDLSVGVAEIDEQHKEIIKRINLLIDSFEQGTCRVEAKKMLDFLHGYFETHFSAEEELMRKINYPDYDSHLGEHQGFMEKVSTVDKQMTEKGTEPELLTDFTYLMIDWLIDHICSVDRELGKYVLSTHCTLK